jgi:hypothetical protein
MALTPARLLATAGFLLGQGLDRRTELTTALDNYQGVGTLPGQAQTAIATSTAVNLDTLGVSSGAEFLSGVMPNALRTTQTQDYQGGVITRLQLQSETITQAGPAGVVQVLGQAANYCGAIYAFNAARQQLGSQQFQDFDSAYSNYSDLVSAGTASAFVDGEDLALQLSKFGTLINAAELDQIGNPAVLVITLTQLGLIDTAGIGRELAELNADLTAPTLSDVKELRKILSGVRGRALARTLVQAQVDPELRGRISSLVDVLEPEQFLDSRQAAALRPNTTLAQLFTENDLRFEDFGQMAAYFRAARLPELPDLDALDQPWPPGLDAALSSVVPTGTGVFDNPVVSDVLGCLTGQPYTQPLTELTAIIDSIAATTPGQDLAASLALLIVAAGTNDPAQITPAAATVESDLAAVVASLDPATLDQARATWSEISAAVISELTLAQAAGIDTSEPLLVSQNEVFRAVEDLVNLSVDPQQVGVTELVQQLVTNDEYGQAVLAAIQENQIGPTVDLAVPPYELLPNNQLIYQGPNPTIANLVQQVREKRGLAPDPTATEPGPGDVPRR